MDKNAIKKFAVWARRELIDRVSQRARYYDITEEGIEGENADSVHGALLSPVEKKQRRALISEIKKNGYQQVMEAVAYTWFNRFSALRFMEVNGYLPTRVRVFTDANNAFNPQILTEALHLDLDGLDRERVIALKQANQTEELYKYLLITQCNALNGILPGMFQPIEDYTELLLPDHLLRGGSIIEQLVSCIPEKDWDVRTLDENGVAQGQVQIIGWLYQYYNTEPKDTVFANLKKNIKVDKNSIPAATQLFTPHWIVRYMVENSLGRTVINNLKYDIWADEEKAKIDQLKAKWKYYLDEAEQMPEVDTELRILEHNKFASGETLPFVDSTFMDPCCGSGHILVEAFDVFMDIYTAQGWSQRDAARRILEKNIFGLDIDDRAAQLAYFSVMMKARQYDRRFFSRGVQPHVYAIQESGQTDEKGNKVYFIDKETSDYFANGNEDLKALLDQLKESLFDAKEYGSILRVEPMDFQAMYDRVEEIFDDVGMHRQMVLERILPLIRVAEVLSRRYSVVVTNPPYMGSSGMNSKLAGFVKKNYPDSKSDLFAVFIERCGQMIEPDGYQAMITQHAWMFLSSYEKLRTKLRAVDIVNMAHLGARAFEEIGGEVVQTTSFVLRRTHLENYAGLYCRLVEPTTQLGKEDMFLAGVNRYTAKQYNFSKIPGAPVAYWISSGLLALFSNKKTFRSVGKSLQGTVTGDNDRFMRLWFEVNKLKLKVDASNGEETMGYKWIPYSKGGEFRRWYGNIVHVIDWENNGYNIRNFKDSTGKLRSRPQNIGYFFKKAITWSSLTTGKYGARLLEKGCSFSDIGPIIALENSQFLFRVLGYVNSSVFQSILDVCCTGLHYQNGVIAGLPCLIPEEHIVEIDGNVESNIFLSKSDWDSFETSWDFKCHPLVRGVATVQAAFEAWERECEERFWQLKTSEEELNRIFIDIYSLQDELTPEVEDKDVTVRRADLGRDIRSLISYAVGCMFGRYSLDKPGLAYAGGEWDPTQYSSFLPDKDNIIPICDDDYFEDDIVNRFIEWLEVVFGKDPLEENLDFIAKALGGKGTPRQVIRDYFLNGFYADHLKIYQKRPIYWLFDSGKKNGFKALIYMHRYQPFTLAQLRTDYVHEQQTRYRTAIESTNARLTDASAGERVRLSKQLAKLQAQADEIYSYEQKVHHLADQMISIDLDDGVKHNYAIFQDVLAKIK